MTNKSNINYKNNKANLLTLKIQIKKDPVNQECNPKLINTMHLMDL